MCMSSTPASTQPAPRNDLKLSIGLVTRLMARWSCSTMLLRYLTWRTTIGTSRPALTASMAALLAPLLSIVHGDLVGNTVLAHGLVEEAFRGGHVPLGGQKKVDGFSLLVDGTVKIFPDAFDLDVGFVHAPAAADRAFVLAGQFLNQRQEANSPPVDRRMVDRHAALLHDLFQVPVAQRVSHIPANADQDHIDWETHPFEIEHVDSSSVRASQFTRSPCCLLTRHNQFCFQGRSVGCAGNTAAMHD